MPRMEKPPRCMATMIGSMPHEDPQEALDLVFGNLKEAPIWPELPRRSFLEGFVAAHVGGMPGIVVDRVREKVYLDADRDSLADEMAGFYERVLAAEAGSGLDSFALDEEHASGLAAALEKLRNQAKVYPYLKTHCIGPVSMQLQLEDQDERPVYYRDEYQDVVVKQVSLQSRWTVRVLKPFAENIIAFLDEPALAAFGSSAYLGVMKHDVVQRLGEAVATVASEGATTGVHVCGNTDWAMVMETGVDIVNYDAYAFTDSIKVYARELKAFLDQGGVIAFGIVPTSPDIRKETPQTLFEKLEALVKDLSELGVDRELLLERTMVTPSCGMGTMNVADTKLVVEALSGLSELARNRFFGD